MAFIMTKMERGDLHMCAYCQNMTNNLYCSTECKDLDDAKSAERDAYEEGNYQDSYQLELDHASEVFK